ncbi:AraC family transcriptional regulator [bacterium]|nr:MAG: AraC family transcriptional regulator [bacterium]
MVIAVMSTIDSSAVRLPVPFIRWADIVTVPAGHSGSLHRRLYDHELVYVLEGGKGQVILDGQTFLTKADTLFLVQPGVFHSFLSLGETQRLLGVHFDFGPLCEGDEYIKVASMDQAVSYARMRQPASIPGWDLKAEPVFDLAGRPRVRRRLEEVVTEYARHDGQSRALAGALLIAAFNQIEREVGLNNEIARHKKVGADAVRRVQRARAWLESEVENPPSIEEIARRVGWSGDHLRRIFRTVLGTSPLETQNQARIRHAQNLLLYRQLSGSEIASRCGFDDPAHFSRFFKAHTGLSPRKWRALEQERHIDLGRPGRIDLNGQRSKSE